MKLLVILVFVLLGCSSLIASEKISYTTKNVKLALRPVKLDNYCSRNVVSLYAVPVESSWGSNLLGSNPMKEGERTYVNVNPGGCLYDFRAIFSNGRRISFYDLNICEEEWIGIDCDGFYIEEEEEEEEEEW